MSGGGKDRVGVGVKGSRRLLQPQKASLKGKGDSLGAVSGVEFPQEGVDVGFDGALGDE